MTLKNDVKSEEKLTCHFKIDIRNLMNLDSRTPKSEKCTLSWAAFYQIMFNCTQDWYKIWKTTGLCFQKLTWGIWQIFTRALESLQIGTLMAYFCLKFKMYEFKTCREVMCHENDEWCKIWGGTDLSFQNWHEEFDEFWPEHLKISKKFAL